MLTEINTLDVSSHVISLELSECFKLVMIRKILFMTSAELLMQNSCLVGGAFGTRDPLFQSNNWQNLITVASIKNCILIRK